MKWLDKSPTTSTREDGAKAGAFWPAGPHGRCEWWGYTPDGIPTGPHGSCQDAKRAVDAALFGVRETSGANPTNPMTARLCAEPRDP